MAVIHYGDGTLYGQADAYYGRISSDLAAAQTTVVRETGLVAKIIDERVNRWEAINTVGEQDPRKYKDTPGLTGRLIAQTQRYWSYRGQADVCVLDNGNVVRVRIDIDDLNVYVQTITDPSDPTQWQAWTLLYTGPNYAVGIAPDVNAYIVYHAKAGGLYRNNVLVWAQNDVQHVRCHKGTDGRQVKDRLWINTVQAGMFSPDEPGLSVRKFDYFYTENVVTTTPTEVAWNFLWYRHSNRSIARTDGKIIRLSSFPLFSAHGINSGESVTMELCDSTSVLRTQSNGPRLIRGVPGDWGHSYVALNDVTKASDGFYYLFCTEVHVDNDWEFSSSPGISVVWQRSKDGIVWSEPTHVGFNPSIAGVFESAGYLYLCGNGSVYRRPTTSIEYNISNFIPKVQWDSPRDNQPGSGQLTIANPGGVNNGLMDLSDRRLIIQPGMKTASGAFEFVSLDDFWIRKIRRVVDGNTNRLEVDFGNVWSRLDNQIRDVMNFVGVTEVHDWHANGQNEPFNYYFDSTQSTEPTVEGNQLVAGGKVLWTAWKGFNPFFSISFVNSPSTFNLYFRHVDDNNYMKLVYNGSTVRLYEVSNYGNAAGSITVEIGSAACTGATRLGIRCRWKYYDIYKNDVLLTTFYDDSPIINRIGYVGWEGDAGYKVNRFDFVDLEYNYTSNELIRQALAMADYHDVIVGSTATKQYALMWGPQTDLPTLSDALRNLLEADKLELIWRDGFVEVGQFKSVGALKRIENRIIQTEEVSDGNRRINLSNVDGNEDTWFEVDQPDARARDRMINAYFDLPELLTEDEVRARAIEEIRRSAMAEAPGGLVPLFFDLWRMDPIEWVDNSGNVKQVRIEGIRVMINQSDKPSQRQELDMSLLENG